VPEPLSDRLRRLRDAAGLSQADAAKRIGVHMRQISKWERGVNSPGARWLGAIASAYGIPQSALVEDAADTASTAETLSRGTAGSAPALPSPAPAEHATQTIPVPVMLLAYWRGRVEEQVRTISGVGSTIAGIGDSLRALQGMLEDATTGMTEFIEGGVFPTVSTLAGRMEDARPGELEAAQALVERFRDVDTTGVIMDTTTKPPARKRGTGGQGRRG
jgi:transcriptional regulator with XRE-family HTH domain